MPESTNPLSSFVVPNSDQTHYTPTTDEVRDSYRFSNKRPDICGKDFGVEFDRWLAAIRAAALDEAAEVAERYSKGYAKHPDDAVVDTTKARIASAIRALKEEKK